MYGYGACGFYTNVSHEYPGERAFFGQDNGLTLTSVLKTQPTLGMTQEYPTDEYAVTLGANANLTQYVLPDTVDDVLAIYNDNQSWINLTTHLNPESDAPGSRQALFYLIGQHNTGSGDVNAAVSNNRCVQMCELWNKCITYEYFFWDNNRKTSGGGTPGPNQYMRCELWVFPDKEDDYAANPEHKDNSDKDHIYCGAANGQTWDELNAKRNLSWTPYPGIEPSPPPPPEID